jgi:hypothetical protein
MDMFQKHNICNLELYDTGIQLDKAKKYFCMWHVRKFSSRKNKPVTAYIYKDLCPMTVKQDCNIARLFQELLFNELLDPHPISRAFNS